jgi:predicted CXXCH cytochrome family protein
MMRLRKVDWLFVVFAGAVVIGVSLLPTPKDRNPMIPTNADHQAVRVEKDCLQCHVPAGSKPMPERHPKRLDCFRCHARKA